MSHPEPDRQCIVCGKWKNVRRFITGTYVCMSCSRKEDNKRKKRNKG